MRFLFHPYFLFIHIPFKWHIFIFIDQIDQNADLLTLEEWGLY